MTVSFRIAIFCCAGLTSVFAGPTSAARGWNSFDGYGVYLHEAAAREEMEILAAKFKPYGYDCFVIDSGWYGEYRRVPGTLISTEKHASVVNLDAFGRPVASKTSFPSGFAPLIARCHALGLKFGVHLMRGIPRRAVELNLPVEGTPYHAADIADKRPERTCAWCAYNYGVDMTRPGAQAWYDGLIAKLAGEGVDFLKVDDITPYPDEAAAVISAVKKAGRPLVLSLSPGDDVKVASAVKFSGADMLRVTHDIWDRPGDIGAGFDAMRKWAKLPAGAPTPDYDMLPFGRLQSMTPTRNAADGHTAALAGLGSDRRSRLTPPRMRTFMAQRAITGSPLILGGCLASYGAEEIALVTDPVMLAANTAGPGATLVYENSGCEAWLLLDPKSPGSGWLAIFNRTAKDVVNGAGFLRTVLPGNPLEITFSGNGGKRLENASDFALKIGAEDAVLFRFGTGQIVVRSAPVLERRRRQ